MILRLVIYLLIMSTPVVGGMFLVRAHRRRQRLLHAAREQGLLNAELTCQKCFGAIDQSAANAVFDGALWYHRRCYQNLLT